MGLNMEGNDSNMEQKMGDKRAAMELFGDGSQADSVSNGYKIALAIAEDILRDTEREALACEDEKEIGRLRGEARGARNFRTLLVKMIADIAQGK
jgi:hypothetical protein